MNKRNVIFFDFDGVIVSTFDFSFRLMHERNPDMTEEEFRRRFEDQVNVPAADPTKKQQIADFFRAYTPRLLAQTPVPGMTRVIRSLAAQVDLAIISSTVSDSIRSFLKQNDIESCFFEVLGNDVTPSKVAKIGMILKQRELDPARCLFITDTLGDIREGAEVGVPVIAVTWGYHDRYTLEKGSPYAIVEHPAELEGGVGRFFGHL